ncbi:replication initiation protein [Fusobacterium varium]|uniref:replication initiation protein n=1 Tax=Fusobacterium varium TaxID=856 RepID=UPI002FE4D307
MGEIIKYHNDMNKVSFAGFKEKELDLFFSICQKMKEKGTNEVIFSFAELRQLSQYTNRSVERLYSDLDRVYKKMLELNLKYEDEKEIRRFVLFNRYVIKKEEKIILIKSSEDFEYVLNNLIGNFTKFDLIEFVSLKSIYSKNMFKLLKQWESKKERKFEIEEFRHLLAIPEKYRMSIIDLKVLNPIMTELPRYFPKLKLEKIKTGRKVTELKFTWNFKKENIEEVEEIQIKISEKLDKAIQKAKKNRFIVNLFTDENIEKLLNKFDENILIKGLNACYKDIQKDVKSLNYLIKAIETAAGKKTKKIVVEKEKETDQEKSKPDSKENNSTNVKEKVLESEFKSIYKYYLGKNGLVDNPITKKAFSMKYEIVKKIVLPEELAKIVEKYSITDNQITDGMSDGYTREETIKLIESNLLENSKMPEELQKEYEEFLAWKKWNEERANKK